MSLGAKRRRSFYANASVAQSSAKNLKINCLKVRHRLLKVFEFLERPRSAAALALGVTQQCELIYCFLYRYECFDTQPVKKVLGEGTKVITCAFYICVAVHEMPPTMRESVRVRCQWQYLETIFPLA